MQNVAAVTRAHVHENVAERGGYRSGLTDVHIHELFAKKCAHDAMLGLARGVHGLERVADEPLRAAESTRNIEPTVKASEVLRGLERFLER
jgi:hypothetical protein